MSRSDQMKQSVESLNARDFVAGGKHFSETVKFHAPGLDADVEGRETVLKTVKTFLEDADASYEMHDVVEHGPFVVGFATATGNIGGQRMKWDLCEVMRYEGDQVAEVWALRGGSPTPATSS